MDIFAIACIILTDVLKCVLSQSDCQHLIVKPGLNTVIINKERHYYVNQCWYLTCDLGFVCKMECSHLYIPDIDENQFNNHASNRLWIENDGKVNEYWGVNGRFEENFENTMSVGIEKSGWNAPWDFECVFYAEKPVSVVDNRCEYNTQIGWGQVNNIEMKSENSQCRWIWKCPGGRCELQCPIVKIHTGDELYVSEIGDSLLAGSAQYDRPFEVTSTDESLVVGIFSRSRQSFLQCKIKSIQPLSTPTEQCSCGYSQMYRIVGGHETLPTEFPMMAGVYDTENQDLLCGGAIIDEMYVVTAAHCMAKRKSRDVKVLVGQNDVTKVRNYLDVEKIIVHKNFNPTNNDNDIALLRVAPKIEFDSTTGPACLPFGFQNFATSKENVVLLGWGLTEPGGPVSKVLQQVEVKILPRKSCKKRITNITPRQLCTYKEGRDACQHDSGGPVMYRNEETWYLVGIISKGKSCANRDQPAINTDVTTLVDWIEENAQGSSFCRKY